MVSTYFLDYYHPFAGLCNQLYLITNHIHDCYNKGVKIYLHKFNVDIFNKKRIDASEVFDIHKTNENLKKLTGKYILETRFPETIEFIPKLCIYPVSSIEILNCLEFHENILNYVNQLKNIFTKGYNAIHFRLDIDAIVHYTFEKDIYNHFMDLCNTDISQAKFYFESLDQTKIKRYCSFLMHQYLFMIGHFGFDKTWYISTSVGKWEIHKPMEKYLKILTDFILKNKGDYYIAPKIYKERELNALEDLIMLRDCEKLIGFEGSSFSEGFCLKVNSIRNPGKKYLFVKEYEEV
jgi:hypothetical protein